MQALVDEMDGCLWGQDEHRDCGGAFNPVEPLLQMGLRFSRLLYPLSNPPDALRMKTTRLLRGNQKTVVGLAHLGRIQAFVRSHSPVFLNCVTPESICLLIRLTSTALRNIRLG